MTLAERVSQEMKQAEAWFAPSSLATTLREHHQKQREATDFLVQAIENGELDDVLQSPVTRYERQMAQVQLVADIHREQVKVYGYVVRESVEIAKKIYQACGLEWIGPDANGG